MGVKRSYDTNDCDERLSLPVIVNIARILNVLALSLYIPVEPFDLKQNTGEGVCPPQFAIPCSKAIVNILSIDFCSFIRNAAPICTEIFTHTFA